MGMSPRLLRPRQTLDSDALRYISAVQAADGQPLEPLIATALNSFVIGCKRDKIWGSIKSACVLCGARTLAGALVPLTGAAPTNNNFVSADYSRKTGLVGNGSSKYLNTNRAGNADPQNSFHAAIYGSSLDTGSGATIRQYLSSSDGTTVKNVGLFHYGGAYYFNNRRPLASNTTWTTVADTSGFVGTSREDSASVVGRAKSTNNSFSVASIAPSVEPYSVYAGRTGATIADYSAARLAFYSIGENLNLALLEARVTRLLDDIAFVINYGLSPLAYNADAINWANRVVDAGATVSSSTLTAVNTFCNAVDAAGIRDRFTRLNVFAGSSLTAALVPLYRSSTYGGAVVGNATDTNNNFVSGDFAETGATGGLKGDGTTKYLNTGFASNVLGQTDRHMSVFFDLATSVNNRYWFGTDQSGCGSSFWAIGSSSTTSAEFRCGVPGAGSISASGKVHVLVSGNGNATSYRNGAASTSVSGTAFTAPAQNIYVHALNRCNSPTDYGSCRVQAYSLGLSMTPTQASAFYSALSAFNSSLSRS